MKRTLCAVCIIAGLSFASLSAEGSIDGLWVGELPGDSGLQAIQLEMRVNGPGVVGSILSQGRELGIRERSVEGNAVTFVTVLGNDETATKFIWTGVIDGDQIRFEYHDEALQVPAVEFVARRQP
jgi:hypothetical protein